MAESGMCSNIRGNDPLFVYVEFAKEILCKVEPALTRDGDNNLRYIPPQIYEHKFYEGESSTSPERREITLHELFPEDSKLRLIGVMGDGGMGKSTLCKQKCFAEAEKFIAGDSKAYCAIYIKLSETNYTKDEKLSWKDLTRRSVIFRQCAFSKDRQTKVMDWMENNEERLLFVLDGLDEFIYDLRQQNSGVTVYDKSSRISIESLIKNLITGGLFAQSKVLVTFRPYAAWQLEGDLRPQRIYQLFGWNEENISTAIGWLCSEVEGENVRSLINDKPALLELCHNPVLSQYILAKSTDLMVVDNKIITTSSLLLNLIVGMKHSQYVSENESKETYRKFAKLAYDFIIKNKTENFSNKDLSDIKINMKDLFFLRAVVEQKGAVNQRIDEGSVKYEFTSRLWQELFCALALLVSVPNKDFEYDLKHCFRLESNVNITRFAIGIGLDGDVRDLDKILGEIDAKQLQSRRMKIKKFIVGKVKWRTSSILKGIRWLFFFMFKNDGMDLLSWISLSSETQDDKLKNDIAYYIPDYFFLENLYITKEQAIALGDVFSRKDEDRTIQFKIQNCQFDKANISHLLGGIRHFTEIYELDFSLSKIGTYVSEICPIINKISILRLVSCGIMGPDLSALCVAIVDINDSKLKTLDLSQNQLGDIGLAYFDRNILEKISENLILEDVDCCDDEASENDWELRLQRQLNFLPKTKLKIQFKKKVLKWVKREQPITMKDLGINENFT